MSASNYFVYVNLFAKYYPGRKVVTAFLGKLSTWLNAQTGDISGETWLSSLNSLQVSLNFSTLKSQLLRFVLVFGIVINADFYGFFFFCCSHETPTYLRSCAGLVAAVARSVTVVTRVRCGRCFIRSPSTALWRRHDRQVCV